MSVLSLGGVDFQGWELPEEVPLGGQQAGTMQKMAGGFRVFDASGPDDAPIKWNGQFRGASAMSRAMALDGMRRAGGLQSFFVLGLAYSVIIRNFVFKPQRAGIEVPYEIELEVVQDLAQGIFGFAVASIDVVVGNDLAKAFGLFSGAAAASIAVLQNVIQTVSPFATAPLSALAPANAAAHDALTLGAAAITAEDALIPADPFNGALLENGPIDLLAAVSALNTQTANLDGYAYLGRAATNLANAVG